MPKQERKRMGKGQGGPGQGPGPVNVPIRKGKRNQFAEGMDLKNANIKPAPELVREAQRRAAQDAAAKKGGKKK